MDLMTILPLVMKGVQIVEYFLESDNAALATRAWDAIQKIVRPPEDVSQADLDILETTLDSLLDEFNEALN